MYSLAQGDVLRMNDVTNISIYEALTFLAYELDIKASENVKM